MYGIKYAYWIVSSDYCLQRYLKKPKCIVLLPLLFYFGSSRWTAYKRAQRERIEAAKPIFDNPDLDRRARLILDGEPDALQKRLPSEPQELVQSKDLLWFTLQEASSSGYRSDEKLQCLRILLDAGAPFDTLLKGDTPVHSSASNTGNAAALRLLFERGADPNATAIFDDEDGPITPLIRAAQFDRWKICAALIEKGARPDFTTRNGKSCAFYMEQAEESVRTYGSPETQADFARLKALVGKGR
ncbi:MAG: ankyrin repeat domain-containing protein [Saprospiraceae bacterium]|nr:ankyrin repeat domain-containing protein [Saprospiraceae bacterium]